MDVYGNEAAWWKGITTPYCFHLYIVVVVEKSVGWMMKEGVR